MELAWPHACCSSCQCNLPGNDEAHAKEHRFLAHGVAGAALAYKLHRGKSMRTPSKQASKHWWPVSKCNINKMHSASLSLLQSLTGQHAADAYKGDAHHAAGDAAIVVLVQAAQQREVSRQKWRHDAPAEPPPPHTHTHTHTHTHQKTGNQQHTCDAGRRRQTTPQTASRHPSSSGTPKQSLQALVVTGACLRRKASRCCFPMRLPT